MYIFKMYIFKSKVMKNKPVLRHDYVVVGLRRNKTIKMIVPHAQERDQGVHSVSSHKNGQ